MFVLPPDVIAFTSCIDFDAARWGPSWVQEDVNSHWQQDPRVCEDKSISNGSSFEGWRAHHFRKPRNPQVSLPDIIITEAILPRSNSNRRLYIRIRNFKPRWMFTWIGITLGAEPPQLSSGETISVVLSSLTSLRCQKPSLLSAEKSWRKLLIRLKPSSWAARRNINLSRTPQLWQLLTWGKRFIF
jgi:hypothetical protein